MIHPNLVGTFGALHVLEKLDARLERERTLTPRQEAVLQMLAEGRSTDEIGDALGIATVTVRNHVRALLRSLGARSRLEAVAVGRKLRLVDDRQRPSV